MSVSLKRGIVFGSVLGVGFTTALQIGEQTVLPRSRFSFMARRRRGSGQRGRVGQGADGRRCWILAGVAPDLIGPKNPIVCSWVFDHEYNAADHAGHIPPCGEHAVEQGCGLFREQAGRRLRQRHPERRRHRPRRRKTVPLSGRERHRRIGVMGPRSSAGT